MTKRTGSAPADDTQSNAAKTSGDDARAGHSDNASPASDSAQAAYTRTNTGLRAAGHGGGELDERGEAALERTEPGYAFSGGGRGHTPVRSQEKEVEEDLESRNGPYVRNGHPARNDDRTEKEPGRSHQGKAEAATDTGELSPRKPQD